MADLSQDQSLKPESTTNPPVANQSSPNQEPPIPATTAGQSPSTDDASFPPIKEEEKFATPKQEEIKKELSELGISSKGSSKKTRVLLATLGVFFLIATLPAAVYLVRQRQELKTQAAYLPGCSTNCDIEIGPGKYGFVASGFGMRETKRATIEVTLPDNTQGYKAYAIWSGESNRDQPNYNDTSIKVNSHDVNAIRTYQIKNPAYNTSQIANIGEIPSSAIKGKTGKVSFNVTGLDNLNSDNRPGGGHGIGIIATYTGNNVGWNKIVIKLWGEWLYFTYPAFAEGHASDKSRVMQFNFPDLDNNRKSDNKFAFFFGEGEISNRDECVDEEGRGRPAHLFYTTSDWDGTNRKELKPTTGNYPITCAHPRNLQPGYWWVTRITGRDLPTINLDSKTIKFTADSLVRTGEGSYPESYTFTGAVAQYPVEQPTYSCWSECTEQSQCEPAGLTCAIPTGDTSQTKRCLDPQCLSEQTCICPPLACESLAANPSADTLDKGEETRFTCKGTSGVDNLINHAEFRLFIDDVEQGLGDLAKASVTKTNDQYEGSIEYTLPKTGDYRVECRVCTSTDSSQCTQWGETE